MNKPQLLEVLQACLLSYEGLGAEALTKQGLEQKNIQIGFKLKDYLEAKL